MSPFLQCCLALICAVPVHHAVAQTENLSAPANDRTKAPASAALEYVSSFSDYRAYHEQAIRSWREANDTVGQIGGWRAYARESQAPEAGSTATPAPPGAKP